MSKKFDKKPLAIAIGTAVAGSLSAVSTANADANPFAMSDLSSGYMQVAQAEMKCGEGKCGGEKMKEQMKKTGEGKCAGAKPAEGEKKAEGKCGVTKEKKAAEESKPAEEKK